jgi:amidase
METEAVHSEYISKVSSSAYKLQQLGSTVEEVSMPVHETGRNISMAIRRLGASLVLAGKASERKRYTLTTFLNKLVPIMQEKWDKTPPAVKSTILNGRYALENYPTLYHKCLNLAVQRKLADIYTIKADGICTSSLERVRRKHCF